MASRALGQAGLLCGLRKRAPVLEVHPRVFCCNTHFQKQCARLFWKPWSGKTLMTSARSSFGPASTPTRRPRLPICGARSPRRSRSTRLFSAVMTRSSIFSWNMAPIHFAMPPTRRNARCIGRGTALRVLRMRQPWPPWSCSRLWRVHVSAKSDFGYI